MPIPASIKAQAEQELAAYCAAKILAHIQDKLRLSVSWHGSKATLIEHRPLLTDPSRWTESSVAQLRFDSDTGRWHLLCADRNGKWHSYSPKPSSPDLAKLIVEIERDRTGSFWG